MPPRSARKAKVDKSKQKTNIKEATPTKLEVEPDAAHPHGLISAEWNKMTYQEDVDEAIGELMDDFLAKVLDSCYDVYMLQQLAPFSIAWAKGYITQTLEHQVTYTEDFEAFHSFASEDSEPPPSITDSWGQGCVPIVVASPTPQCSIDEESISDGSPIQTKANVKTQSGSESPKQEKVKKDIKTHLVSPHPPLKTVDTKSQVVSKISKSSPKKWRPSLAKSTAGNTLVESTEGRETLERKKTSLERKKEQPIPKLDPLSLPRHWELPQYEILDKDKPDIPGVLTNKQQKSPLPLSSSKDHPGKFRKTNEDLILSGQGTDQYVSSLPVKLDAMILTEGVSLRNSPDAEMKTIQSSPSSESSKLKPMNKFPLNRPFSVDQVTVGPAPRVIPMPRTKE